MLASLKDAAFARVLRRPDREPCLVHGRRTPPATDAREPRHAREPARVLPAGIPRLRSLVFAAFLQKMREKTLSLWPAVALTACIGT